MNKNADPVEIFFKKPERSPGVLPPPFCVPPRCDTSLKKRIQQSPGEGAVRKQHWPLLHGTSAFISFHDTWNSIVHYMLFFTFSQMGIPEPDKFVTEFSQIFLHRKAAFLKNAISLFDYFIDQIPRRKKEIDGNLGLL